MASGTNRPIKLGKLERLVRRAFKGRDAIKYVELAQSYRGSASTIFVGNRLIRDIVKTLDELEELKK